MSECSCFYATRNQHILLRQPAARNGDKVDRLWPSKRVSNGNNYVPMLEICMTIICSLFLVCVQKKNLQPPRRQTEHTDVNLRIPSPPRASKRKQDLTNKSCEINGFFRLHIFFSSFLSCTKYGITYISCMVTLATECK